MIAIILHHVEIHLCNNFNDVTYLLPRGITQQFGYLATGVFFLLSGYGMIHSMRKNKLDKRYVKRKFVNMIYPFIATWVFYLIYSVAFETDEVYPEILTDFLTLSLPVNIAWFYKVIIGIYVIVLLLYRFVKSEKVILYVTFALSIVYILAMIKFQFGTWWFNSVICFPIGMFCARYKDYISRKHFLLLSLSVLIFIILNTICRLFLPLIIVQLISAPLFAISSVMLFKYVKTTNKLLSFIGNKSLYFYLMHYCVYTCFTISHNYVVLSLFTTITTTALVYLFDKLQNVVSLRFKEK